MLLPTLLLHLQVTLSRHSRTSRSLNQKASQKRPSPKRKNSWTSGLASCAPTQMQYRSVHSNSVLATARDLQRTYRTSCFNTGRTPTPHVTSQRKPPHPAAAPIQTAGAGSFAAIAKNAASRRPGDERLPLPKPKINLVHIDKRVLIRIPARLGLLREGERPTDSTRHQRQTPAPAIGHAKHQTDQYRLGTHCSHRSYPTKDHR